MWVKKKILKHIDSSLDALDFSMAELNRKIQGIQSRNNDLAEIHRIAEGLIQRISLLEMHNVDKTKIIQTLLDQQKATLDNKLK